MPGFGASPFGSTPFGSGGGGSTSALTVEVSSELVWVTRSSLTITTAFALQAKHATLGGDAMNPKSWTVLDPDPIPVLAVEASDYTATLHLWRAVSDMGSVSVSFEAFLAVGEGVALGYSSITAIPPELRNADRARRDYQSRQFEGDVVGGLSSEQGDYAQETGRSLRRKTLIRRLSSVRGSFRHAQTFGLTTATKTPYSESDLLNLAEQVRMACLQEPDAVSAEVSITPHDTVVVVSVVVTYGDRLAITAAAKYDPAGSFVGVHNA